MTIVAVGVCVNGKVRRSGSGIGVDGRTVWGITSPMPCEKCGGKGCAKPSTDAADAK